MEIVNTNGNNKWWCSECDEHVPCVRIGEIPGYESMTAYLCINCALKAYALIRRYHLGRKEEPWVDQKEAKT